jgi:hypothetical protein
MENGKVGGGKSGAGFAAFDTTKTTVSFWLFR